MTFEKINNGFGELISPYTIVCCSGTSCKDGTTGITFSNSKNKSMLRYGPLHSHNN